MKKATKYAHIGRPKVGFSTSVNPAITKASTLLFEKASDLYTKTGRGYGRHGSELHDMLKEVFCDLENGAGCALTPSGLSANTLAIQACVKANDHVLVTDSTYGPVRTFCDTYLSKFAIEIEYYDPRVGADIEKLIKPNTSCILLESPGSLTFEIQDIPAIVKIARDNNIATIVDNTWSAGLVLTPLDLGADISVHAATKYFGGHSDLLFGAVISRSKEYAEKVRQTRVALGYSTSAEDTYQVLRGFRTLTTRFEKQAETALALATWLGARPEVESMLHPGLPDHPDHEIWKRDFTGAASLFAFVLKPHTTEQINTFLDSLHYFAKGFSYGGYESLIIHCDPQLRRNHKTMFEGPLLRIACGLEDFEDLRSDLEQGFEFLKADDPGS